MPSTNAYLDIGTNPVVLSVTDVYGNTVYSTNTIVVQDRTPPVIEAGPQSVTNNLGGTATFAVIASACTPLCYQWYFDNAAMAGQTNAVLTLADIGETNAGMYYVTAQSEGGSTESAVALLAVNIPLLLTAAGNSGGGIVLTATGPASANCIWEMDTNLTDPWLFLHTNDFSSGMAQYIDTAAATNPRRFYRAVLENTNSSDNLRTKGTNVVVQKL